MKTKKFQKPFSIEAWRNGAKVEARDGRSVRILCTDLKFDQPIVAAIMRQNGMEFINYYDADGRYCGASKTGADLVLVKEVEEPERWAEDENARGEGWYIGFDSTIWEDETSLNDPKNYNEFATEKQAKSALAMARISQLMAHDERYGGVVTDNEWADGYSRKYIITRQQVGVEMSCNMWTYCFLAFHTPEQRDLFLKENERLVKDYLMID